MKGTFLAIIMRSRRWMCVWIGRFHSYGYGHRKNWFRISSQAKPQSFLWPGHEDGIRFWDTDKRKQIPIGIADVESAEEEEEAESSGSEAGSEKSKADSEKDLLPFGLIQFCCTS